MAHGLLLSKLRCVGTDSMMLFGSLRCDNWRHYTRFARFVQATRRGDFEAEEGIRINPQIEQSLRHSRQ